MEQLRFPQDEILRLISVFFETYGRPPYRENKWFIEKMRDQYEGNYITNIKGDLKKLGFVTEKLVLTDKGKAYVRYFFDPFSGKAGIRVQGTASAGPQDDTFVDLDDLDHPSDVLIHFPNTSRSGRVLAVRVEGDSMREMGIFPGDLAIIELLGSSWWPSPQDVILTKYLPHNTERADDIEPNPADYVGPVIKVYLGRFGERGCRLGWKTSNDKNPFLIKADGILPIGRVIQVVRDYNYSGSYLPIQGMI